MVCISLGLLFSGNVYMCVCAVLLCNILRGEGKVCHSERPLSPLERMGQALGRHKAHQAHVCFQKHPPRASIQASSWAQGRQATSRPMCVLVLSLRERRAPLKIASIKLMLRFIQKQDFPCQVPQPTCFWKISSHAGTLSRYSNLRLRLRLSFQDS